MAVVAMDDTEMTPVPMRIPDADWRQFRAVHGREAAVAVRAFIAWQLHRPGAGEPARPDAPAAAGALPVPPEVLGQLIAWYLRQPGAELPRRPGGETTAKMIRVPAADWREFRELHGGKATEAVKMFIAWSLHRPGAQLPVRLPAPDAT
jgi:hypothetical protein